MRAALYAAICGTALCLVSAAEAQNRRLVIDVKPRSWLDAGKVVPVGSMQNYVYDVNGFGDTNRFGARGSNSGLLPDRFTGGRGFTFMSPIF